MRTTLAMLVLVAGSALAQQRAATAATPATPSNSSFGVMSAKAVWGVPHSFVVRALEQTPDSLLSFRPAAGIRSLGELFAHVADGEHIFCSLALGEPMMNGGVEDAFKKSTESAAAKKAAILAAYKGSAGHCDKAYAQTDAQVTGTANFFGQTPTRMFLLGMNGAHDYEHYGNIVTYLRLKGITPPSSQR